MLCWELRISLRGQKTDDVYHLFLSARGTRHPSQTQAPDSRGTPFTRWCPRAGAQGFVPRGTRYLEATCVLHISIQSHLLGKEMSKKYGMWHTPCWCRSHEQMCRQRLSRDKWVASVATVVLVTGFQGIRPPHRYDRRQARLADTDDGSRPTENDRDEAHLLPGSDGPPARHRRQRVRGGRGGLHGHLHERHRR